MENYSLQLLALALPVTSPLGNIGTGKGFGPFNFEKLIGSGDPTQPLKVITTVVSTIIGFITVSAGIYFLFQLIIGAFGWMVSSGDKNKLQHAQDRMVHAIIGLIIVVATYAIVGVISTVAGLDILLKEPGALQKLIDALQLK